MSVRHAHLSRAHVDALFGVGHDLTPTHRLTQPGQFACAETVGLIGARGELQNVRIVGPERKETQVEISRTDQFRIGVSAPVRPSGSLGGSPGARLIGPEGQVDLRRGVIQAERHLHLSTEEGKKFGVGNNEMVMVRVGGPRGMIFDCVRTRVGDNDKLDLHLDTDEANAAGLEKKAFGYLLRSIEALSLPPENKRRLKRWRLIYYLRLFEHESRELVGHVIDISGDGFRLLSEEPVPAAELSHMWMETPGGSGSRRVSIIAKSLWCQQEPGTQLFQTGFRLIDVNQETAIAIQSLVSELGLDE